MSGGLALAWTRMLGFAVALALGTTVVLPLATITAPPAIADEALIVAASAGAVGEQASSRMRASRTAGPATEAVQSEHAFVPLPPAFVLLVSAVVGIAVLGSRRRGTSRKTTFGPANRYAGQSPDLSLRTVLATARTHARGVIANDDGQYGRRALRGQ